MLAVLQNLGAERAGDRRLLDDEARVAAVEALENAGELARGLNDVAQVGAGARGAAAGNEHRILQPFADEIVFERRLILQVALLASALPFVNRRAGKEEGSGLRQATY